jgi:hypothetical protein
MFKDLKRCNQKMLYVVFEHTMTSMGFQNIPAVRSSGS